MKIPATVIWYNPDDENIKNIRTYIDYVEKLYIIDNSKENNKKRNNLSCSLQNYKNFNFVLVVHQLHQLFL